MGLVKRAEVASIPDPAWRDSWVRFVEWSYPLDHATAERWVFVRWLAETGRLTEGRTPPRVPADPVAVI